MTASQDGAIIPITLTVNGRTGVTLYAPPWEDEDGDEWQGFLGDGAEDPAVPGYAASLPTSSHPARRTTCPTTRPGDGC